MTQDERDELTDDLLEVVLPRLEEAGSSEELGDIIAAGVASMIKAVCELLPLLVEKNQRAFDDGTSPVEGAPAPTLH
jgi:hypothetical protein